MSFQIYVETDNHDTTLYAEDILTAKEKARAWASQVAHEKIKSMKIIEV